MTMMIMLIMAVRTVVMVALTVEKANVVRKVVTEVVMAVVMAVVVKVVMAVVIRVVMAVVIRVVMAVVIRVMMAVVVKVVMAVAMKAVTAVVVKVAMAVVTIAVTKAVMTHRRPTVCRFQLVLPFQLQQVNLLVPHNHPASVHQLSQVYL